MAVTTEERKGGGIGRWIFRIAVLGAILFSLFYLGQPIYWKLSATLHDIRHNHYDTASVKHGISELVHEAQRTVGWGSHGDFGSTEKKKNEVLQASGRKLAGFDQSSSKAWND